MANEFRVKHGLILTGSSYLSESMFAPNLPEETSPQYYITWRQADGRFEASVPTAGTQNSLGCWDYITSGDVSSGEFRIFPNNDLGSGTTSLLFHFTDNNSIDQTKFFNSLGQGSVIILAVNNSNINFLVKGITLAPGSNDCAISVEYQSGTGDTLTASTEACLIPGVTITANTPASPNCLSYKMGSNANNITSNSGEGVFDRVVSGTHYSTPLGTMNTDVQNLLLNPIDLNGSRGLAFLNNFSGTLEIGYKEFTTRFKLLHTSYNPNNSVVFAPITYIGGDINYTIDTGENFTICKSFR